MGLACSIYLQQPAWGRSREFDITTRATGRHTTTSVGDLDDEDEEDSGMEHGKKKKKVAFTPSIGEYPIWLIVAAPADRLPMLDTTHTIYYRGHWLRVRKRKEMTASLTGS
jgi:chaperone BCS1